MTLVFLTDIQVGITLDLARPDYDSPGLSLKAHVHCVLGSVNESMSDSKQLLRLSQIL